MIFANAVHAGGFSLQDDGKHITILENDKPVLVYNYAFVEVPEAVAKKTGPRQGYIHPLYGLDREILTDDYPDDHFHHRGVYWAWPYSAVGGKRFDLWALVGCHSEFVKWRQRQATESQATLEVINMWVLDPTGETVVREEVSIRVHPASDLGRAIDFALRYTNVADREVTLEGTHDIDSGTGKVKGYGGFMYRIDASREPRVIATAEGVLPADDMRAKSPWADLSAPISPGGPFSGAAIFQHPGNPGYPHEGWLLRHYGTIGASWPCDRPHRMAPGDSVELKYRLYVHRGDAADGKVAEAFAEFVTWVP